MNASDWDQRYAGQDFVWSVEPNRLLADEVGRLRPGRALDLGAGEGRNAVWMATRGWQVTAVDFSPVGIEKGRRLAQENAATVEWIVADVSGYRPAGSFDLVVVAYLQLPFSVLSPVLTRAAAALAPGGTLLLVGHDRANLRDGVGGPQDPAVLHTVDEVSGPLAGLDVQRAEQYRRPVEVDGVERLAVDTVVRAVRPVG
ncbi:MAG: class I SAM-dependent methyltransferase [Pseudonocardia sp.]|nr:class I SAM-dependent methyltransferase [Pseudonocardia sp.]